MFSGIVEGPCKIRVFEKSGENRVIGIGLARLSRGTKIGDSISVSGICLTVTKLRNSIAFFEAIEETLERTTLGKLRKGDWVNIERSLRLSSRIGGHLVTGHIDGVGRIVTIDTAKDSTKLWVSCPKELLSMMIPKGSIALDGISLTLVDVLEDKFSICLIPHTLSVTTLGMKRTGDLVNLELDMMGKFVWKFLQELDLRHAD